MLETVLIEQLRVITASIWAWHHKAKVPTPVWLWEVLELDEEPYKPGENFIIKQ